MNRIRRKALQEISDRIEAIMSDLETLKEEEEEYRDNMPEGFYGSDRYEKAEDACDSMQFAFDSLEEAVSSIAEAIE